MKETVHNKPTVFQSELDIIAHNFIIKATLYVIMPILIALACYFAIMKNTISLLMILWIFLIDIVVIFIDRKRIPQAHKIKSIIRLYQLQVLSCGLLLFYGICIMGRWELIPWTFAFYYLAVIIIGIKGGTMIASALIIAVCIFYPFTAPPATTSAHDLMIRFFPSSILCIVFIVSSERVRNIYRHQLIETNTGLVESERRYRHLYHRLTDEISARKKVEDRFRQSQEMESIGNLAEGIAHDFNNLLLPIVGFSKLLLTNLSPGTPEYRDAQCIYEAGNIASALVTQIRSFSRRADRKVIPVSLPQILKQVFRLMRQTIPSDIEIQQDIQHDCRAVAGDPVQIHQVIMNLFTNAYHAVESLNGKIVIQLREVLLSDHDVIDSPLTPGSYAILSICDMGIGMAPDILEKIFEPYFTTKETGKGTGLGLAVVYDIVSEHGGDIQVFSEIGRGSTFDIYLPVIDRPVEKDPEKITGIYKTGSERILLVDDEPRVLSVQRRMLERLGYQVVAINRAAESLKAFIADPEAYDLVITDMAMPELAGDGLAKELLSIRPDIPIIICTGFNARITPEMVKAMGIRGFLMKPIKIAVLAQMVRNVLDGSDGTD